MGFTKIVPSEFTPSESAPDARGLQAQGAPTGAETQLSQPGDVQAAHNYFSGGSSGNIYNPTGLNGDLPSLSLDATAAQPQGLDYLTFNNIGGGSGVPSISGLEAAAGVPGPAGGAESLLFQGTGIETGLLPGLEQGALAGMPPGAEPISPMIQMILKMPGGLGIVGSFFEMLASLLFPTDGGFLMLFDPSMWAGALQQAFTSFAALIGGNIPFNITLFGSNTTGMFQSLMHQNLMDAGKGLTQAGSGGVDLSFGLEHPPLDGHALEIGGVPGKPLFESNALDGGVLTPGGSIQFSADNNLLAMETSQSFGPTISSTTGQSVTVSQDPSNLSLQANQPPTNATGTGQTLDSQAATGTAERGSLIDGGPEANATAQADGSDLAIDQAPANYTIQSGDNLWNIARDHLGSGTKWKELYNLNSDLIGDNPNLVFAGTELKLPDSAMNIAGPENYMVKSGDNLWNIARDHMGGGKNWHEIFNQNGDVIGSDPSLIHPGQQLSIPEYGKPNLQLAHNSAPPTHHAASTTTQHHAPSHAAHKAPAHSSTGKMAHAKSSPAPEHTASDTTHQPSENLANNHAIELDAPDTSEIAKAAQAAAAIDKELGLKAIAKSL